jgi:hypothetical protein
VRYYLAGPMTGLPKYNFMSFEIACQKLRKAGFNIVSPHEIEHGETEETRGNLPYETYLRAGLKMLLDCEGLILMTGWETSGGCMRELYVAHAVGMQILFYNPVTDVLTTNAGR